MDFSLNEFTLRALAQHRDENLRKDIDDLGVKSGLSQVFYSRQFKRSREICEDLFKDPYKISYKVIDQIIALPCLKELTNKAFELGNSPSIEDEKWKDENRKFFTNIFDLSELLIQTFVPIIEDYVRLGMSLKTDTEKKALATSLKQGIELYGQSIKLSVSIDAGDVWLHIKQGDDDDNLQGFNWNGYEQLHPCLYDDEDKQIDFNLGRKITVDADSGFHSNFNDFKLKDFFVVSDEKLNSFYVPNSFKPGGFVYEFMKKYS